MAEMTVEQAVEMSKHEVSSFVKRRSEIAALLESQAQAIKAMKCCGNCKHMENVDGYDYCYVACKTDYRFSNNRAQVCGNDKCDKWEGVSRDG